MQLYLINAIEHLSFAQPVAMQQPTYWAVPPGANPAGTVTVPYAGPAGSQMQIQGQVQVCTVFISLYFCEFNCDCLSVCKS